MTNKLVFSTDKKNESANKNNRQTTSNKSFIVGDGPIKVRLEKKGRGGKVVTKLWNLPMSETDAMNLKKQLQAHLACGATLKDSAIELRGDLREKVIEILKSKGLNAVKAGG